MASLAELEQLEEKLVNERNALGAQYQAGNVSVLPQIQALNAEIASVGRQINALAYPPASAAADVKASDDSATQNPQAVGGFGQALTVGANGRIQNTEFGTNPPVITTIESQSVNPNGFAQQFDTTPGGPIDTAVPGGSPGTVTNDDSGDVQLTPVTVTAKRETKPTDTSNTGNIINASFNGKFSPQPNVLDQYASYTYSLSWYLMAPASYKKIQETGKLTTDGLELLVQSGGAPTGSSGGTTSGSTAPGRNTYFSHDYYINNLEITSVLQGKGSEISHNLSSLKFTVIEPMGISLIGNLRRAVEDYYTKLGLAGSSYIDAEYCLFIRFYGYDDQGRPVQVGRDRNSATDSRAVVEKFYPFTLTNIVAKPNGTGAQVEYQFDAFPIPYQINFGQDRNVVHNNAELRGRTVRDLLVGNKGKISATDPGVDGRETESTSAPQSGTQGSGGAPKATATNAGQINGLMEELNRNQLLLLNQKLCEVVDEYELEFFPKELGDSLVVKTGLPLYKETPMTEVTTGKDAVDPNTQSGNFASRTEMVLAGTSVTQLIDKIMRNSQYVSDQSKIYYDEVTGERKTRTAVDRVAWFRINVQATPKTEKRDNIRGCLAYKIKYIITPYNIVSGGSDYFPSPVVQGVHKKYDYWFTGQNTQVLSWDMQYNTLYRLVMSTAPELSQPKTTSNGDPVPRVYQPYSNQSSQGADLKTNEPNANLADSLYDPYSLNTIRLKIIGDPAWLQQGEVATGVSEKSFKFTPFNDDGTINFASGDVVYSLTWNRPQDYDLNTGLMDPSKNNTASNGNPALDPESYLYLAKEVISTFRAGKFEQLLDGTLIIGDEPDTKKVKNDTNRPVDSTATNLLPNVRSGDGVVDTQAIAGTNSKGFTNTQQPNLISSAVTGINRPSDTADTSNGSSSLPEPAPATEPTPAESNGDVTPRPILSSAVTDAQPTGSQPELAGPPKLPAAEDTTDWDNVPSYEIRGTSESLKQRPVTDQNPQLMNKEY